MQALLALEKAELFLTLGPFDTILVFDGGWSEKLEATHVPLAAHWHHLAASTVLELSDLENFGLSTCLDPWRCRGPSGWRCCGAPSCVGCRDQNTWP